jgi:hypothetical protein
VITTVVPVKSKLTRPVMRFSLFVR